MEIWTNLTSKVYRFFSMAYEIYASLLTPWNSLRLYQLGNLLNILTLKHFEVAWLPPSFLSSNLMIIR